MYRSSALFELWRVSILAGFFAVCSVARLVLFLKWCLSDQTLLLACCWMSGCFWYSLGISVIVFPKSAVMLLKYKSCIAFTLTPSTISGVPPPSLFFVIIAIRHMVVKQSQFLTGTKLSTSVPTVSVVYVRFQGYVNFLSVAAIWKSHQAFGAVPTIIFRMLF